jgi:hypothetical protein
MRIVEANNQPVEVEMAGSVNCLEWAEVEVEGEEEQLRLELMQDKYGSQIAWTFTGSNGDVLASGGNYPTLMGATSTQMHIEYVTVAADECVKFTITDSGDNGICCSYGHGYYIVKDSQGNVLFGDEDNGQFGSEALHLVSVKGPEPQVNLNIGETQVGNVDHHHADFIAPIEYNVYPDEVGFECKKVTSPTPIIVNGFLNEFSNILGYTDELEAFTIYVVRAYAVVNGETYYGQETTFQTMEDGVVELNQSLKLYPNPTANVLNIEGKNMTQIDVYNAVGQCVMMMKAEGDKVQLSTESLNNGIYFVRIKANDGAVVNRTFSVAR